jgi:hypothetical protein
MESVILCQSCCLGQILRRISALRQLKSHARQPVARHYAIERCGHIIGAMLKVATELPDKCRRLLLIQTIEDAANTH